MQIRCLSNINLSKYKNLQFKAYQMDTLELRLDKKITKDSLEYKSMLDSNKPLDIYKVAESGLNATNANRGGAAR